MSIDAIQLLGFHKINNIDDKILEETNEELSKIKNDVFILNDSINIINQQLSLTEENINMVSINIDNTNNDITICNDILKQNINEIVHNKYNLNIIKMVSGALIGGIFFGISSVALFGIVPALFTSTVGIGSGAIIGYLA